MTQKKIKIKKVYAIEGPNDTAILFPEKVKKIERVNGTPYFIVQDGKNHYGLLELTGDHLEEVLPMEYCHIFHTQESTKWNRYLFVTQKEAADCHLYDAQLNKELLGGKNFQGIFPDSAADGCIVVKTNLPEDSYRVADIYSGEYLTEPQIFIREDKGDAHGHLNIYDQHQKIGTFATKERKLDPII